MMVSSDGESSILWLGVPAGSKRGPFDHNAALWDIVIGVEQKLTELMFFRRPDRDYSSLRLESPRTLEVRGSLTAWASLSDLLATPALWQRKFLWRGFTTVAWHLTEVQTSTADVQTSTADVQTSRASAADVQTSNPPPLILGRSAQLPPGGARPIARIEFDSVVSALDWSNLAFAPEERESVWVTGKGQYLYVMKKAEDGNVTLQKIPGTTVSDYSTQALGLQGQPLLERPDGAKLEDNALTLFEPGEPEWKYVTPRALDGYECSAGLRLRDAWRTCNCLHSGIASLVHSQFCCLFIGWFTYAFLLVSIAHSVFILSSIHSFTHSLVHYSFVD